MKRLSLLAILLGALHSPQTVWAKDQTVSLTIPTMDCATCPITIKAALMRVQGVSRAKVSYARREAVVVFDNEKATLDDLKKATTEAGYPSFVKMTLN
jgi:mercuric ion binding protein